MATSATGSDTTESDVYPSDGKNTFKGKSPSSAEKAEEDAQPQSDTTDGNEAEPVDPDRRSSTSEGARGSDDATDTTEAESRPGEDASPEEGDGVMGQDLSEQGGEPHGEDDASRDGEPDGTAESDATGEEAEGESPEAPDGPVVQYHGTEPEDGDYEDYAFISGVDPDQRYETVEDMVNGHEELIQHSHRQRDQIGTLQEKMADLQAAREGEVEEMRTKLSIYEEQLGEDEILGAIAQRHMPEEFQGLSREDVEADREEEFLRAKWKAEEDAKEELEKIESAREEAQSSARERQEEYRQRAEDAQEWLETVDHDRLGVSQSDEEYVREAIGELTPEEMQGQANVFDLAHQIRTIPALMPDEAGLGAEKANAISEMLIEAVGAKARERKRDAMKSRSEKITKKAQSRSGSRAPDPEPAQQETATRTPGRAEETFRKA